MEPRIQADDDSGTPASDDAPGLIERGPAGDAMVDGVDLHALARQVGTPCYVYSARAIRARIAAMRFALRGLNYCICYALKANPSLGILHLMAQAGLGADIVSGGELRRTLRAGIAPGHIVFSGVGKTAAEIDDALSVGICTFNLESGDELCTLNAVARARGVVAHAAVRINPDVDAGTHDKISTGRAASKFGVSIETARRWFADHTAWPHVRLDGLHVHIGSQITTPEPFQSALMRVATLWRELESRGHPIASIDVGGGLGVCHRAGLDPTVAVEHYADVIRQSLSGFRGRIVLEPGRHLVAEAGLLLTRAIRIKPGEDREFLVVDAAMNDLLRPSLYGAWHDIVALHREPRETTRYDIVGPVCESGDTFALARDVSRCIAGDLLAIGTAGAYGASMASTYNSRPLAAEVLIDGGRHGVIRPRQSFEQMIAGEQAVPAWVETA